MRVLLELAKSTSKEDKEGTGDHNIEELNDEQRQRCLLIIH
jgi:hypothetical protein